MGKKPEVSLEKRAEINVLLSEGLSQKEIASKLEISQSAVSKIIKRIIEFGTYTPKPRPGRPRVNNNKVRRNKSFKNDSAKNKFNNGGMEVLNNSFLGLEEDNFFLSLCEIESTIKKNDRPSERESRDFEYENVSYKAMKQEKPETRPLFEMEENSHFFDVNHSHPSIFVKVEGKKIKSRPSFEMEENPHFIDVNQSQPSIFVKVEGKKIKSEFKRPSDVKGVEEEYYNTTRVENQRIRHIKMEDKRPHNFIKSEVKPRPVFRSEEEVLPPKNIKKEIDYYEGNDIEFHDEDINTNFEFINCENNDDNTLYNNNYQNSNDEISYNNVRDEYDDDDDDQTFYPSISKSKLSQSKKMMGGYFRIYDKSMKRRARKSDVQIKPTTYVKISERKPYHEKRSSFKSTSPPKIRFHKERF